jgi:hypothetical protein
VGACLAFPSEAMKSQAIDDDFLMLVIPGVAMGLVALRV